MADLVTLSGILQLSNIGPGTWVLASSEGTIELRGEFSSEFLGQRVVIQGVLEDNYSIFSISDQCLVVHHIQIAP